MNIQKGVYFVLTHNIDSMMNNNYKGSFKTKGLKTTDLDDNGRVPLTHSHTPLPHVNATPNIGTSTHPEDPLKTSWCQVRQEPSEVSRLYPDSLELLNWHENDQYNIKQV